MAYVTYTSDFGIVYYAVPFTFLVLSLNNNVNQYTLEELVPQIILNELQELTSEDKTVGCILPKDIISRKIKVLADDSNEYNFMFPFNFFNPDFTGVIEQLNSDERVKHFTIIGEKIKTSKLNFILKINGYQ